MWCYKMFGNSPKRCAFRTFKYENRCFLKLRCLVLQRNLFQKLSWHHDTFDRSLYLGHEKTSYFFWIFMYPHTSTCLFAISINVTIFYNQNKFVSLFCFKMHVKISSPQKDQVSNINLFWMAIFSYSMCLSHN